MPQSLANRLSTVVETSLPNLRAVAEPDQGADGDWTPKQELGHLIDSASNNHMRFVRAALDGHYHGPTYAQEPWVNLHGYADMPWTELVEFWAAYNRLLVRLIANIPESALTGLCTVGDHPPMSLGELIEDYMVHMQHHLDSITHLS